MNSFIRWLRQLFIKPISTKDTVQFYKRGSNKQHIGRYSMLYLVVTIMIAEPVYADLCLGYGFARVRLGRTGGTGCWCTNGPALQYSIVRNNVGVGGVVSLTSSENISRCSDPFDTACVESLDISPVTDSIIYFKNTTDPSDFFKCDWTVGRGYSNSSKYTPSSAPVSAETAAPQPINATLPRSWLIGSFFTLFILVGFYCYRYKLQGKWDR